MFYCRWRDHRPRESPPQPCGNAAPPPGADPPAPGHARHHPGIEALAADVRAGGAADAIVRAAIDRWGRLDVLVNNAGATRGAIVNVSSTFGRRPLPGAAHYAASKSALEQLTRSWALELAPEHIRVNAVAPGPTESEALSATGLPEAVIIEIKQQEIARIPLGRRGQPEEVAAWVLHAADANATWFTGQIIGIDGGLDLA